jgi:large subunit ribosomal protein L19
VWQKTKKFKSLKKMTVLGILNVNLDIFYKKLDVPEMAIGDTARVTIYLELPKQGESAKEKIQVFEGVLISKHLNKAQIDSTVTIRKMFQGGGTEKVFVLNSPWLKEIKILSKARVKRAKLYYLRSRTGKSARLQKRFK